MERLQQKVKQMEENYKYSARLYGRYNRMISIPSIVLTSVSSIFSFLSSSEFVKEYYQDYLIIGVAFLTTGSTMLQTISSSCEFNVKKLKFTEATQELNKLSDKVFFEMQNPNDDNFIDNIEKEIEDIKNKCKFIPLEAKKVKQKGPYVSVV